MIQNNMYIEDFVQSPFFNIGTWQIVDFNNKKTLVSNSIGNSQSTTLEFNVITNRIEIDYAVSSESNYDKFYIYIDDVQKVCISGSPSVATLSQDLDFGSHKITFKYYKDISNSRGRDRAEIYQIRYKIPYKQLFLIKDNEDIKGLKDNVLTKIDDCSTGSFLNYGIEKDKLNELIKTRNIFSNPKPKLLFYTDNPAPTVPLLKEKGTPHGEIVTQKNSVLFDKDYINNIKDINITATVDQDCILKFFISKDDGETWLSFKDNNWINAELNNISFLDNGMNLEQINALTEEQLKLISDTKKIKLAWYMKRSSLDSNIIIKQIKLDYNTSL